MCTCFDEQRNMGLFSWRGCSPTWLAVTEATELWQIPANSPWKSKSQSSGLRDEEGRGLHRSTRKGGSKAPENGLQPAWGPEAKLGHGVAVLPSREHPVMLQSIQPALMALNGNRHRPPPQPDPRHRPFPQ